MLIIVHTHTESQLSRTAVCILRTPETYTHVHKHVIASNLCCVSVFINLPICKMNL